MEILTKVKGWAGALTEVGVSLLSLGIILEVLFNGQTYHLPHIFLVLHLCVNRCLSKDQWQIFMSVCTSSRFGKTFSNLTYTRPTSTIDCM